MRYHREPLSVVRERVLKTLETENIPYSFRGLLGSAITGLSHMLHGHLEFLSQNMIPDTSTGEVLDRWGAVCGVTRQQARHGSVKLKIKGTKDSKVPKDWVIASKIFSLSTDTSFPESGEAEIICDAVEPLSEDVYKAKSASIRISSEVAESNAEVLAVYAGIPAEPDDSLRRRIYQAVQTAPQGGSYLDYIRWVEAVPGVKKAWVKTCDLVGVPGHVWIAWAENGFQQTKKDQLEKLLAQLAPAHAVVTVKALNVKMVDVEISVTPNTEELRKRTSEAMTRFFEANLAPGGYLDHHRHLTKSSIPLSRLSEALSAIEGEESHRIISPIIDIPIGDGEVVNCDVKFR